MTAAPALPPIQILLSPLLDHQAHIQAQAPQALDLLLQNLLAAEERLEEDKTYLTKKY